MRAEMLQTAGHWRQAAVAWQSLASAGVPATGKLDAQQSGLLLATATAAAQAGDQTVLDWVRARDLTRLAPGHDAELLRLLTEAPVRVVADMPRAAAELALARDTSR